jgi:hypothetical protein
MTPDFIERQQWRALHVRMDAAAQRERDLRFWRGLAVAIPCGVALWAVIIWAVLWVTR